MKNIFKFLGIALMASAMMVACGEKENTDPTDTTPTVNPTPDPTPATASIDVTFGATQWSTDANSAALLYTGYISQYNVIEARVFKTAQQYPFFDYTGTITGGTYELSATTGIQNEGTDSAYVYYSWPNDASYISIFYADDNYFAYSTNSQGNAIYTGDWHPVTAKVTINAFDANTLKTTFSIEATMYDYESWYYMEVNDATDADTKTFKATINDYQFTNWTK
ncbi:MAG: hypothetical protein IJ524_04160 [Bacteroidales bacterium]|nr:hypothetical protein [Bacteroidales bacterium]